MNHYRRHCQITLYIKRAVIGSLMLVTINKNLHKLVLAILYSQARYVQLRNWNFCECSDRIFEYSALFKLCTLLPNLSPKCSAVSKY